MDIFPEFNCGQHNITYNCSPYTFNSTEYCRTVICVEDTDQNLLQDDRFRHDGTV
ncbi:hypothetical protein F441_21120 [Phytophthora nicotianae CJ01A1]|uniref:Uncharacterized protein n=4 Tax=Phytophthora nicotianae TaxID=4792 RepID=V9DYA9_PHYNI|nr:hypothetical protein F443_21235 [Phytophthora nicotianae P1569]ETK72214.1 hypothetical protein L915_20648 [Phytophthora nicotianae]ETP01619.1 hypothetical protein F441_21120 [Phytophthora nicotianae CJ01A1]ETP29845.1 hypothetical protein F442_21063 [Phytophthora nicotianae P10297]ETL25664.1 hypothetical protein L916_20511 [Phytophthora nicotianae]